MAFQLTSKAFAHDGEIPRNRTCDGPVTPPVIEPWSLNP